MPGAVEVGPEMLVMFAVEVSEDMPVKIYRYNNYERLYGLLRQRSQVDYRFKICRVYLL